ncbi:MAG: hypothetical protein AB7O39_00900 [Flavobacteriaceae bacterium]
MSEDVETEMAVWMSEAETELFVRFLSMSDDYFEFGMGGSTVLAAGLVKRSIRSVDSDMAWMDRTRKAIGEARPQVELIHVDIGPTRDWGHPAGRGHEARFPDYSRSIRRRDTRKVDFCLVDGRFRVACFLTALAWLDRDAILAVHDYRSRPEYHVVERFARPIAEAEDMTMFVRRAGVRRWAIDRMAARYRHNPA